LNAAARDIDVSKIEEPKSMGELPANRSGHKLPFVFEPTRHKLHLPGSDR
jgi:hypothetical protein